MEFNFNMNQVSVIGHKRLDLPNHDIAMQPKVRLDGVEEGYVTSWEKPRLCQVIFLFEKIDFMWL